MTTPRKHKKGEIAMKMKEVHRLPLGFGPVKVPEVPQMAKVEAIEVAYETDGDLLSRLHLPEGLELTSNAVRILYHKYNGCSLLAGRGYNSFLIALDGRRAGEDGLYIPVRLTSDMFTMIDGRYGDYGFPDLYADIPDPVLRSGGYYCYATEYEYKVMELYASGFAPMAGEELDAFRAARHNTVWLTDEHRADIVTRVDEAEKGEGSAVFTHAEWFDAPALCGITNFMKTLPVKKTLGAVRWTGAMEIGAGGEL